MKRERKEEEERRKVGETGLLKRGRGHRSRPRGVCYVLIHTQFSGTPTTEGVRGLKILSHRNGGREGGKIFLTSLTRTLAPLLLLTDQRFAPLTHRRIAFLGTHLFLRVCSFDLDLSPAEPILSGAKDLLRSQLRTCLAPMLVSKHLVSGFGAWHPSAAIARASVTLGLDRRDRSRTGVPRQGQQLSLRTASCHPEKIVVDSAIDAESSRATLADAVWGVKEPRRRLLSHGLQMMAEARFPLCNYTGYSIRILSRDLTSACDCSQQMSLRLDGEGSATRGRGSAIYHLPLLVPLLLSTLALLHSIRTPPSDRSCPRPCDSLIQGRVSRCSRGAPRPPRHSFSRGCLPALWPLFLSTVDPSPPPLPLSQTQQTTRKPTH